MEELIPIFFFIMVGSVLILRPITRKLGLLIEAMARERTARTTGAEVSTLDTVQLARITAALDQLDTRLDHVDDRIAFVERLIETRSRPTLTG